MTSFVVALLMIVTPMHLEAQTEDLEECSIYVHKLTDEELIEFMKEYEYISMIDDMEKQAAQFDSVYEDNN